ncbi:hypothetical protein VPNG_05032 [Cytospora leucostoma]|uniref:F-box domain-containing protein n=1 Tax=Cytospora leucostoma TaxID=1230097 RepID=A0A423X7Q5_9PEZI|nr:hypothetical protein VPNG_05032 [Cytospora leucostoma]
MAAERDSLAATEGVFDLLGLAPEIVQHIIKQAPKEDLKNIRLANKELDKNAVRELFSDVFLSPDEEQINTWASIGQHDTIRRFPRHAVIHTQPDIETLGEGDYREIIEPAEEFEDAVAALARFPNVDSLEIGFTAECIGVRDDLSWWEDGVEEVDARKDMLRLIFQAVKDRAADKDNRTIRKLTIVNLQNCPIPDFTRSDLFRDVMGQLEELHLQITQEYNRAGPDHDYTRVELQTFPGHLISDWLEPVSGNLKALSIGSAGENWGPFPGHFRPSGLSFPKLKTLALVYHTLAHDDDLNWITGIKSLETLLLTNCMIASRIRIDTENVDEWKVCTDDWQALTEEQCRSPWPHFAYHGKWSDVFRRISSELPNLVHFRFHGGSQYRPWDEDNEGGRLGVRVLPQRYVVFDNGILPTHWTEAEEDGGIHHWTKEPFPNFHKQRLEEDQKSLDELLRECRRRATEKSSG